jgi:hypothetical protein
MKRSLSSILTLLVLLGLVLSACAPAAPTQAPVAPAPTEAPTEAPVEEQPSATEAPAMTEETITVGFTSSLTGAQEVSSKRQVAGFNLWMDQVNESGGIKLSDGTVVKIAAPTYDD